MNRLPILLAAAALSVPVGCGSSAPPASVQQMHSSSIATSPDGARLFVVHPDADSVSILGASSRSIEAEILLAAGAPSADPTSHRFDPAVMPRALALDSKGANLFVTGERSGSVYAVDTKSATVRASAVVCSEPIGILVSADDASSLRGGVAGRRGRRARRGDAGRRRQRRHTSKAVDARLGSGRPDAVRHPPARARSECPGGRAAGAGDHLDGGGRSPARRSGFHRAPRPGARHLRRRDPARDGRSLGRPHDARDRHVAAGARLRQHGVPRADGPRRQGQAGDPSLRSAGRPRVDSGGGVR